MSTPRDPWSDPSSPTEEGPAYTGPPPTVPPPPVPGYGYGPPGPYGPVPPPYGYGPPSPYGHPAPYAAPYPAGPYGRGAQRRPGQVIGAAVLSFVQGLLVLIASLYVWFFASIAQLAVEQTPAAAPAVFHEFAREGTALAIVQLVAVASLVAAGILALNRRTRPAWLLLVAVHVAQLLLTAYWWAELNDLLGPAATGEGVGGVLSALSLFFAAAPLVALGLILFGGGRRWFTAPQA